MAHIAIARKYRPSNFSEVVGQEKITETLKNAIKLNIFSHAYIFAGPRGVGKTTLLDNLQKEGFSVYHSPVFPHSKIRREVHNKGDISSLFFYLSANSYVVENNKDKIQNQMKEMHQKYSCGKYSFGHHGFGGRHF